MCIGHAVTGVGYVEIWDPDGPGPLPLDNYAIVHDNWPTTAKNVAIPWHYWDPNGVLQQTWNATISVVVPSHQVRDVYVDAINGDDINGDGTAGNPYATIQKGIDEAFSSDTVLVADGTYTGPGNNDLDFKCRAITVRSESGALNCTIDCGGAGRGFYFHCGETDQSVVSGFSIINGDSAFGGGGIACENSSPTIEKNIISDSKASSRSGGGISCNNNSSPMIINNTIMGNWAEDIGGGISCTDGSSPTIIDNIITENESLDGGGGIGCHNSSPEIRKNVISKNSAGPLGAPGGGICCADNSSPEIINNTITENKTLFKGGGICSRNSSNPTVLNTILWADIPDEIYVDASSGINITYSDIQGGWLGQDNIDADPMFVDPNKGDYHLQSGSPCIDAGDPNSPNDPDGARVDMGAFYYAHPAPKGLVKVSGDNQSGFVGTKLSEPLVVLVKDQNDNPIPDVRVDFSVTQGDGSVNPTSALTDADGKASTELTLGQTAGLNQVTATVNGLSVVFSATGQVQPRIIHVATTGDDETGDGSEENPYATIHRAFEEVSANDTVLVWPGMYSFDGRINWPDVDGIVLKSKCGPDCTILDANNSNRHLYLMGSNIGSNTKISGFTFQNGYGGTGSGGSIIVRGGATPVIEHNIFRDNHTGDNGGALFFNLEGVEAAAVVRFNVFDSNEAITPPNSKGYGGAIGGASLVIDWEVDINSNIFINNIDSDPNNRALYFWQGRCNVDYNLFYNNIPGVTLGSGNLTNTDPEFVNYTNHDYHLLPTSPCIDAGDPNFDYSNELEPNGNRVNIGVYGNTAEAAITLPMVGDVSGNNEITAYDAVLILQYCVGLISEFPVESMLIAQNAVPAKYTVSIPEQTAKAGETIFVPIQIDDASVVAGGMTLHYDMSILRAKEVSNTIPGIYWKSNITDDQIRIAFAQINPIAERKSSVNLEQPLTNLFYVKFDVIDGTSGRESLISFDEVKLAESLSITLRNGTVTVLPQKSMLLQNYPNPFNPETWIPYQLAADSPVTISMYNAKGQLVRTLHFGNQNAGIYMTKDKAAYWDSKDGMGQIVASGIYYYTLKTRDFTATRKMVILK